MQFVIDYFTVVLPNGTVRHVKSELIQKKWPSLYENIKGKSVFGLSRDVPNCIIEYVFSESLHEKSFDYQEEIEKMREFVAKYGKNSIPSEKCLLAMTGLTEVKTYKHPDGKWFLEKYSEVQVAQRKFVKYMLKHAKVDMRVQILRENHSSYDPPIIKRISQVESIVDYGDLNLRPILLTTPSERYWIDFDLGKNNFRLLDDDELA